ncbi:ABC transporter permease [Candidatus Nesciobacter abundans]|uniref:ABC transporter permease n=1 Tax=Candidatus Nesciobacter abundans TaxID=2601668 RepID=A0A5C0UGF2_9PROT|nr:FtsX-like permease family protein [Candidatus Nesciobacter abundans]QEK39148.1 ABC transporter permease [Candidatus Nesciobacter abundans]
MTGKRTKKVMWITILSIGFSLGILIKTIAIMRGFQESILQKSLHIYGHMDVVSQKGFKVDFLKKKDWYVRSIKNSEKHGMINHYSSTKGVKIVSADPEDIDYIIQNKWINKKFQKNKTGDVESIAVGQKLAKEFGLRIGSYADLLIPHGFGSNNISIKKIRAKVVGIFSLGFHSFDRNVIFTLGHGLDKYTIGNPEETHTVYTTNPEKIENYKKEVYKENRNALSVWTWKDTNPSLKQMFVMQNLVIGIFIGLFVLCAMVQSTNSLWMLISEKTRDISLLKAFGASKKQIFWLFANLSIIMSISSVLIGTLFGVSMIKIFPYIMSFIKNRMGINIIHGDTFGFTEFFPRIEVLDLVIITFSAFFIMCFILFFAARSATKTDILKGINF